MISQGEKRLIGWSSPLIRGHSDNKAISGKPYENRFMLVKDQYFPHLLHFLKDFFISQVKDYTAVILKSAKGVILIMALKYP